MERRTSPFTLAGSRNRYTRVFLKRSALLAAAIRDGRIATYLLAATTNELRRVQEHSLLLSRRAECRVATFLIDLSMRLGTTSYLDLPMSHQDIADHLGFTIETLSRTITTMEKSGSIARLSGRILVLAKPYIAGSR